MSSSKVLHYFNPGYEASVAIGDRPFTPRHRVSMMRRDLYELPYYLADPSDHVLAPDEVIDDDNHYILQPWGWAPELQFRLSTQLMRFTYDEMRGWASRHHAIYITRYLHQKYPHLYPESCIPYLLSEDKLLPHTYRGHEIVVKEEFASSGRGVYFLTADDHIDDAISKIRGGRSKRLFVEYRYDKICDRGYEFYRDDRGQVHFIGPSDFMTMGSQYVGNRLLSADKITNSWNKEKTDPMHDLYVQHLSEALEQLDLGRYIGYMGVDTITYKNNQDKLALHPCIELNVRPTMGLIALRLSQYYIAPELEGCFRIHYFSSSEELSAYIEQNISCLQPLYQQCYPCESAGHYLLTTPTPQSQFIATVELKSLV